MASSGNDDDNKRPNRRQSGMPPISANEHNNDDDDDDDDQDSDGHVHIDMGAGTKQPKKSILVHPRPSTEMGTVRTSTGGTKKVSFFDFKGLMAPVFSCFHRSSFRLDFRHVENYAQWLKSEGINGVLINSITGEGPALGLSERKLNAEVWWKVALEHDLVMMLQVGGAPLPDVFELARQAEELGVHAVLCLPELFYKPRSVDHLVGFCQLVAKACSTRPFFYYHLPRFTDVHFDMLEFCQKAEINIPNFYGLVYSSANLVEGIRCLAERRVIMLGTGPLLASGLLMGFESAVMGFFNVRPDLGYSILNAINNNDMLTAREHQKIVNTLLEDRYAKIRDAKEFSDSWVCALKTWFNSVEERRRRGVDFTVGPARKFF